MSFLVCVGRWGGLSFTVGRGGARLVLGWLVVALLMLDADYELCAAAAKEAGPAT